MDGREDRDELEALQRAWAATAKGWRLSDLEKAMLLHTGGVADAPPGREAEHRMRLLVQIDYLLPFPEEQDLHAWLRTPLRDLGGASPLEVLAGSTAELSRVRRLLEERRP